MLHWQMCGFISQIWAVSESILKQLIKHLFHTFLLLFRFKSKYGCPISSKITKLYFILNIIQLPRGLKIIWNSVPLLNFPFKWRLNHNFFSSNLKKLKKSILTLFMAYNVMYVHKICKRSLFQTESILQI